MIAGVFRDIYAGQVYSSVGSNDAALAERIVWRVVISHSAFLDAARRRDALLAQKTWSDYLSRRAGRWSAATSADQPIDIIPLWRAQAGQAGSEPTPRRALVVATEIRARIAEGGLGDGDRLPPLAELADEFGISRPTLREALRILEMEFLLDLRTGDRGGATIRTPSTRVAAQLAGIVLEARRTTFADFFRALQPIVPAIMGLVASRIGPEAAQGSRQRSSAELAASTKDTARFVATWRDARDDRVRLPSRTPRSRSSPRSCNGCVSEWSRHVTADAKALPWVRATNRNAQRSSRSSSRPRTSHDSARATQIWAECLNGHAPWFEESELR